MRVDIFLRSGAMATLLSLLAPQALASQPGIGIAPGAQATFEDPSGRRWCVTVTAISLGIDGTPWAWFTVDADRRRIGNVRIDELEAGCKT